jgi:hypothetical protein
MNVAKYESGRRQELTFSSPGETCKSRAAFNSAQIRAGWNLNVSQ